MSIDPVGDFVRTLPDDLRALLDPQHRFSVPEQRTTLTDPIALEVLPDDLRTRLLHAGVTTCAQLPAIRAADPALSEAISAAVAEQQAWDIRQAFAGCCRIGNYERQYQYLLAVPLHFYIPLLHHFDEAITQQEACGDMDAAQWVDQQQSQFRQLLPHVLRAIDRLERWLDRLTDEPQMLDMIQHELPARDRVVFLHKVAQRAVQCLLTNPPGAARLRQAITTLQHTWRTVDADLQQAVYAFLDAPTATAARAIVAAHPRLLQSDAAQNLLEQCYSEDPVIMQQIAIRAGLLRELRNAIPTPEPGIGLPTSLTPFHMEHIPWTAHRMQITGTFLDWSMRDFLEVPWIWHSKSPVLRRSPLPPLPDASERPGHVWVLEQLLIKQRESFNRRVVLYGPPGSGTTTIARFVAQAIRIRYTAGVIWTHIGPDIQSPDQVQPILDSWGARASWTWERSARRWHCTLDTVGRLIGAPIVLDDVCVVEAIQPLLDVIPSIGVAVLITTSNLEVARALQGTLYQVGGMSDDDAMRLIARRLTWCPPTLAAAPWLDALVTDLERHPMALDLALRMLGRMATTVTGWQAVAEAIRAMDAGQLPDTVPHPLQNQAVARVLTYIMTHGPLSRILAARRAFRLLGVLAPGALIDQTVLIALWDVDAATTVQLVQELVDAGILEPSGEDRPAPRWRMHAILHAYALAWLQHEGEHAAAMRRIAAYYRAMMASAVAAGRDIAIAAQLPHLRAVMAWAIPTDTSLACDLLALSEGMQLAVGISGDGVRWAQAALDDVRQQGMVAPKEEQVLRRHLARAQQHMAFLPSQDQRATLHAALTSADAMLQTVAPTDDSSTWIGVQLNRALILGALAHLPDEDVPMCLTQSLDAYDQVLALVDPAAEPLAYASTQHQRAVTLAALAEISTSDRWKYLQQALEAYDVALQVCKPDDDPLVLTAIQGNRCALCLEFAEHARSQRGAWLAQALEAGWLAWQSAKTAQHHVYRLLTEWQIEQLQELIGKRFPQVWTTITHDRVPDWLADDQDSW